MAAKTVVAEIALYGTPSVGAGYIARSADGRMFGDGEPHPVWSMTCALWNAEADLRNAGVAAGLCEVHVAGPGGRPLMAVVEIGKVPAFGALTFGPGRFYELSAEALLSAAERVA
jgi:hypothetical protein